MLRRMIVLSMLLACCYCADVDVIEEETRAKKSKKKLIRLVAMVLLFVFSKVAIFKVATFFFFMAFFQKLFALGGVLLTYMMKNQQGPGPVSQPVTMYGAPSDYNTVGYSYGPPDHESTNEFPSIADFGSFGGNLAGNLGHLGGAFNWLSGKQ